jgi:hypothetical protein
MKKLYVLVFGLFLSINIALASEITFTANKTEIDTDGVVQLHISVDGEIDGGQIGIKGLENFKVVGQHSSSQIQIINGAMTSVQEKILSISPLSEGKFTLLALAKKDGKEIQSSEINIEVKKSLAQTTKEKLLKTTSTDKKNNNKSQNELKELLKTESIKPDIQQANISNKTTESLNIPEIKSFPKIQHLSAFNIKFWFDFFCIIVLLTMIVFGIRYIIKNLK